MAAAVLPTSLSSPIPIGSRSDTSVMASSHTHQPSSSRPFALTPDPEPSSSPKSFKRLRSSLEQSIRTATRSKGKSPAPSADDFDTVAPGKVDKGKGREVSEDREAVTKDRERSRMLRRLESKVGIRRSGKDHTNRSDGEPQTLASNETSGKAKNASGDSRDKVRPREGSNAGGDRVAGFTSFLTPSLRMASMSSPALQLSSRQPSPSSKPTREKSKRASVQPTSPATKEISGPTPLAPRRDRSGSSSAAAGSSIASGRDSPQIQKPPKHRPPPLPLASSPSILRTHEPVSPGSPTRPQIRKASASAGYLPLNDRPTSPTSNRAVSPTRSRRVYTPTQRVASPTGSSHSINQAASPRRSTDRPSLDGGRPSLDGARPSLEGRRPSASRAASPGSALRPRAVSPSQVHFNASTASLSVATSYPEHRELIRTASSLLCKEMARPRNTSHHRNGSGGGISKGEWEEVEVRLGPLARLERVWGKSGAQASQSSLFGGLSSSGLSAGGEEREKRLFCQALRDGYVLCQLMNKLRPGSIPRVDPREDGFARTSNVTKFLASCTVVGLCPEDLFERDDLIEGTSESLARVAQTIVILLQALEFPGADRSKIISGGADGLPKKSGPYGNHGAGSRSAASTPNLSMAQLQQRSTSPTSPIAKKRWSPPTPGLPTVRSDSPDERASDRTGARTSGSSSGGKTVNGRTNGRETSGTGSELDEVPPIPSPPPRSPLRTQSTRQGATSPERASVADSTRASIGDSVRASFGDRQSVASSALTDTTAYSSLLEVNRTNSNGYNKFGTIRTVTTDATDPPSLSRADGSSIASSLLEDRKSSTGMGARRERRPSEVAIIDLSRVAEENEDANGSARGSPSKQKPARKSMDEERVDRVGRTPAIRLGKGKWPDDFLDAFSAPSDDSVRPWRSDPDDRPGGTSSASGSSPRKLAYVGVNGRNDSVDSLGQPLAPRRPTHRPRHSIDAPALLPKESLLRRDSSPDANIPTSPRVMLRRNSTKTGPHRNGIYIPKGDEPRSSLEAGDPRVPFPRSVSGEHTPTSDHSNTPAQSGAEDKPRQPRGRFQSDIEGASSRRRPRPNSYDELGAKQGRSRFESMVNLGVGSSNASASDLITTRNSIDGSAVRQTLIVREDGRAATQFQLGNCIGRGQFGSVYRALNLNTGQMVAVKRIRLEGLKEDEIGQLMKEVDLLKSLSHPSIVKYEGMARDENTLNIVLEYAENGSLGQTLKAFGKLNERLVASYVVKILEGLDYLHQNDVVHCDLKAANILTTKNGNVKLSDFGVSLNLRAMTNEMKDIAGTPNWMAPEVIELKGASTKSDIWSLACTMIELLTGRPPYADVANSMTVMFRIVEDDMPPLPEGCSDLLKDFLRRCFNKDPAERPSADDLCEHEWLQKNWLGSKDVRPQDSIPFLRRVSADMAKSEAVHRYLAGIDMPISASPGSEHAMAQAEEFASGSPPRRRVSIDPSSSRGKGDGEATGPREHSFVKTTFSKPMLCKVCFEGVKRHAVLCEQCSLIAHAKCAPHAPPTCDLRAQLLLYAQYAEKGFPGSPYSNAMDVIQAAQGFTPATSPSSEVGIMSSRTSLDTSTSPSPFGPVEHPPTAFKMLAAFKRARSSLSAEHDEGSSTSLPGPSTAATTAGPASTLGPHEEKQEKPLRKKHSILKRTRTSKERPQSASSHSTTPHSSSMRSAVTAAESLSGRKSNISIADPESSARQSGGSRLSAHGGSDRHRSSRFSSYTGVSEQEDEVSGSSTGNSSSQSGKKHHHHHHHHHNRDSKSGGCVVQ